MGKKDKTKLKSKSGGGSDGHGKDANHVEQYGEEASAANIAGWDPRQSHAGERIDGFGPDDGEKAR